jgi:hypothetical protein
MARLAIVAVLLGVLAVASAQQEGVEVEVRMPKLAPYQPCRWAPASRQRTPRHPQTLQHRTLSRCAPTTRRPARPPRPQVLPGPITHTLLLSLGDGQVVGVVRQVHVTDLSSLFGRRAGPFYDGPGADADAQPDEGGLPALLEAQLARAVMAVRCPEMRQRMLGAMLARAAAADAAASWAADAGASSGGLDASVSSLDLDLGSSYSDDEDNDDDEDDHAEGPRGGSFLPFWRHNVDHRRYDDHDDDEEEDHRRRHDSWRHGYQHDGPWERPERPPFWPHPRPDRAVAPWHRLPFGLFGPARPLPPRDAREEPFAGDGGQSEPGFAGLLGGDRGTWGPAGGGAGGGDNGAFLDWFPLDPNAPRPPPPSDPIDWSLRGPDGRLNWPVVAFAALSAGCVAMWAAVFAHVAECVRAAGCRRDALADVYGSHALGEAAAVKGAVVVAAEHTNSGGQFVTLHYAPLPSE